MSNSSLSLSARSLLYSLFVIVRFTTNLFSASGSGVVGKITTEDDEKNVSFTVEGVGDTIAVKLATSLDVDEIIRTLLEAAVALCVDRSEEKVAKLAADIFFDC